MLWFVNYYNSYFYVANVAILNTKRKYDCLHGTTFQAQSAWLSNSLISSLNLFQYFAQGRGHLLIHLLFVTEELDSKRTVSTMEAMEVSEAVVLKPG